MMLKGTFLKATAVIVADDPGHFRNGQHETTGFSHSTPEDFKPASAMLSTAAAFAADGSGIQSERIFSSPTSINR